MINSYFEIISSNNKIINGNIRYTNNDSKKPLIIISHGFKGFKDWGFFPFIAEKFAEHNAISIVFNFSCNGKKSGTDLTIDVEEFAQNTISQEIDDLNCLISNFIHDGIDKKVLKHWNGDIFLAGHSMGGGISLLVASNSYFIKKLSIWASIGSFERYSARQKEIWKRDGFADFKNQRTNQTLRMNATYINDLDANTNKYDLAKQIAKLHIPIQIINAKQDVTIQAKESELLTNNCNKELTRIDVIPRSGHTFGIDHPMEKTSLALENLVNLCCEFFQI
jgi:pimeloyl-ACP methyl ester carboxylesterase